ncbi:MAG: TolC family protein, partial [Synergistaceae bacterium]|nr:TolC family protein [Synergistaceae bacterium]
MGSSRLSIAAIILLCAALSADASVSMDIKEAIELALLSNSTLLSLRQETAKAEAFRLQADGSTLPEVGLSAGVDSQKELQTSDGSNRHDNKTARLTLSQPIYTGGRSQALRRQSSSVKSIADLAVIDAENRAIGELFARFYNVLLQERRVETERSAALTSELHVREVTRMSELGLSNRLEVIRASQLLATNKADLSAAEGAAETALLSLMNYMAIPPEERRPVTGSLHVIDVRGDRAGSLALAMANRADKGVLESELTYQEGQIEIERSASRPRVSIGASAGYLDPYMGVDSGDDTWR